MIKTTYHIHGIFLLIISLLIIGSSCQNQNKLPSHPDFNHHIRPILSNNCYTCHGPDPSSREAGLRLDNHEGATKILESGKQAIVPGNPKASELIKRISSHDPDNQMPPPEAKKQLTEKEIQLLSKWIEQGAEWKEHWAFISPEIPQKFEYQSLHDNIDYLIDQKIASKNLTKSPKSERSALIRRLYYTLTGLPPSPENVKAFLNDDAPNAYEKIVDEVLASPHFGEHWARHWMDLMRYAESKGHEFDFTIGGAWRYRDYLIRAFNQDLPYDELVKEHLAGDQVTPRFHPTENYNEAQLATAFYAFGEGKHGPVDLKIDEAERIDNIIDVTTKSFQGMTVACAKCHDHKFDPLPTTDYYALYGILESARFTPVAARTTFQDLEAVDSIELVEAAIRKLIAKENGVDLDKPSAVQTSFQNEPQEESNIIKEERGKKIIGDFRDGSLDNWFLDGLAFGKRNAIGEPIFDNNGRLLKFENGKASSKILGKGLQGMLRSPNFTIKDKTLTVKAKGKDAAIRVVIDNFQLIQWPIYGELEKMVEGEDWRTYSFDLKMWEGRKAYVEILSGYYEKHQYIIPGDAWVEVEWAVLSEKPVTSIAQKAYASPKATSLNKIESALKLWANRKVTSQRNAFLNHQLQTGNLKRTYPKLKNLLDTKIRLAKSLYDSTFVMGVTEGNMVESPVFVRGNTNSLSEEKMPHGFLTALKSPEHFDSKNSRLALAEVITDTENPLTARVMVNRIWHHLFGRGIVETVDNFGMQGKLPTHPELLDYLSVEFMKSDWSIKHLIREIVLSETFQGSTKASSNCNLKDPENLYLSHFPVRRLWAESIRDGILTVTGNLNTQQFGEPIPIHLTQFMEGRGRPTSGPLDGDGRRSVYNSVRRNFLNPMLLAFDMPVPFSTFGKRNVSNVPAQSLTLMNDPFVQEQAARWAAELICYESAEERIETIYWNAFSRAPDQKELERALEFLKTQATVYQLEKDGWKNDHQVWTDFCHAIFNMKEFIFLL